MEVANANNKFFLIKRSTLVDRIDSQFYKESFDFTNFIKLSKVAIVKGGKRIPLGLDYSNITTEYLYLRVADMNKDNDLNYNSLNFISKEVFEILKRYEILENDLAISIAGTIGKVLLLRNIPTKNRIILTENCAKIIIKKDINVLPNYLEIILNLPIVQKQIQLNYIQTTIPKLGLDRVKNLMLPEFPNEIKQKEIILFYISKLTQKQQKETQAKELLKGIDTYILNELGITVPETDNSQEKRMFVANFSDVVGLRLDPLFFKNSSVIESTIFENLPIRKIANISKGQSITKEKITEGDFPVIAGGQSSPYTHNISNYDGNIITISASGAYSGFVWYHNYPIFASDCIVLHSKNENEVNTEFIYFILKALQQEIYKMQQGAGQPHVYARDIEKLTIPVPKDINRQLQILEHIKNIQQQITTLQTEANAILENAKSEVEKMILG